MRWSKSLIISLIVYIQPHRFSKFFLANRNCVNKFMKALVFIYIDC